MLVCICFVVLSFVPFVPFVTSSVGSRLTFQGFFSIGKTLGCLLGGQGQDLYSVHLLFKYLCHTSGSYYAFFVLLK